MKKGKKVGNRTDSNFFTSEFKLTSTQFPKHHRQHKMLSTFSQMKQGVLDEESKKSKKSQSKDGRPVIEQLRLLTCTKEDDFKLPRSFSKRSTSKNLDKSREKKSSVTEIFENFYQEARVVDEKKRSMGYMECLVAQRRFKPLSVKNLMKDKLEKTALEKFKDAVSNENNQTQNQISEKNAEALYTLLKSARKRQEHDRPAKNQQNFFKRQDSSDNRLRFDLQIPNEKQNKRHLKQALQGKIDDKKTQQDLYRFQKTREESTGIQDMISKNTKQLLGKLRNNGLQQSAKDQRPNFVLQFDNKEKFDDSSQQQFSDLQLEMESKVVKNSGKDERSTKNLKQSFQKVEYFKEKPKTQQVTKEKPIQQLSFKTNIQRQKDEIDILAEIPSVKAISASQKAIINEKEKKQSRQADPTKAKNLQKEDYMAQGKYPSQKPPVMQTNPQNPLGAPPKLNGPQNMPKKNINRVDYRAYDVDQDELQQISLDDKKNTSGKKQQIKPLQPQAKPPLKQQPKPQAKKQLLPQAKPENKPANKPVPAISRPQKASIVAQPLKAQQQSSFDPLDELEYFIEKIQDIGQYRINSKDLYNDKSISKQLIQSYKICSYYMAHHFLYLSKRACDLFKADVVTKEFYTITAQELNELKKEGQLQFLLETTQTNMQEAKKLLKKCYEESKPLLKKQQQILLLDAKINYHLKCCTSLIKEFKFLYSLYEKKPDSETIQKRCCYLIEIYSTLKLLNGQEIKECLQLSEIRDYRQHIKTYKHLLMAS